MGCKNSKCKCKRKNDLTTEFQEPADMKPKKTCCCRKRKCCCCCCRKSKSKIDKRLVNDWMSENAKSDAKKGHLKCLQSATTSSFDLDGMTVVSEGPTPPMMSNSRLSSLTDSQRSILSKFKENVADIHKPHFDDLFYVRWLRARHFDLKKSEAMLRNHIRWRHLHKADTILQDFHPPEVLRRYSTGGQFGQDRDGAIVYIDPFGNIDMKGLLMCVSKRELIRGKIWLMEDLTRRCGEMTKEHQRKYASTMVIVFDAENLGMKHLRKPGLDVVTDTMAMFEEHYPETLKQTFVVNAPKLFSMAFSLVKPILGEETSRKIVVCDSNFKETLLRHISPDQLPAHWGGKCVDEDGDPRCPSRVKPGGIVPKCFYFSRDSIKDLDKFKAATVGMGSSLQVPATCALPGTTIRWRFITEDHDINFGIFRKTSREQTKTSQMEEVFPVMRVNSQMVMEEGTLTPDLVGDYVLWFDNSYSYTKSKKVRYSLEVGQLRQKNDPTSTVLNTPTNTNTPATVISKDIKCSSVNTPMETPTHSMLGHCESAV